MDRPAPPEGPLEPAPHRAWAVLRQVLFQAGAASVATQDSADYVPPGTLPARSPGRRPSVAARPTATAVPPGRRTGPRRTVPGRRAAPLPIALLVVVLGLVITGVGYQRVTGTSLLPSSLYPDVQPPPRKYPVLAASEPNRVRIRAVGLDAPVQPVGLAPDGTIATPPDDRPDTAGWYDQSPTPGQYGPSVLVGHVDTRTGPAVFHELTRVRSGDRLEIDRADGSTAVFQVDSTKKYDKSAFPADQVFGDFDRPGLRLITCGGRWVGGRLGYADNVVVYATLVSARGG
ncbi:class F sortase [Plantactinospora siamensis]|uniref:Class F sortase n=1 Tax=Plantactinospora siamensis TaxID=555372 RepID=A0ABV6NY21_9ACTN